MSTSTGPTAAGAPPTKPEIATFEEAVEIIKTRPEDINRIYNFVRRVSLAERNQLTADGHTLIGVVLSSEGHTWQDVTTTILINNKVVPTREDLAVAEDSLTSIKEYDRRSDEHRAFTKACSHINRALNEAERIASLTPNDELIEEACKRAKPLASVFSKEARTLTPRPGVRAWLNRRIMGVSAFFATHAARRGFEPSKRAVAEVFDELCAIRVILGERGWRIKETCVPRAAADAGPV